MLKNVCRPNKVGLWCCNELSRKLHVSSMLGLNPKNVTEVRIPVPWGHVAGKWWGNTNEQPILAIHGWQDNAGSFDPLLELLPDNKPVLAIDSPGHGLSSHFPDGMFYSNANYLMVFRRIQKYYQWDKITIIGHSEGGVIGFLMSAIFPELVNGLITLDVVKTFAPDESFKSKLGEQIDAYVAKSNRAFTQNPKYSLEEIQNLWMSGVRKSITLDAVKILMKRGTLFDEASDKYCFTRDPKLKVHPLESYDENQSLEFGQSLKCHYLALKFSEGKFFDYSLKNSPTFISTVSKSAKSFEVITVEGHHFAHMLNPERVAPLLTNFIKSNNL